MPAQGPDSLVERDVELSALATATADAERGAGRLLVVEGPAGIGKTQLLRWVRDYAAARGTARILAARGTELEAHLAFGVVRQLLDPLLLAIGEPQREELFTGGSEARADGPGGGR